MNTKAPVKTPAKTPAAPAAARMPQPPVAAPEHEAERPDIAAQLEGAARLGHSLGAVGVDSPAPPIIQRQELPEEEEEELQMKRESAAVQRQALPEEDEELMMKRDDQRVGPQGGQVPPEVEAAIQRARGGGQPLEGPLQEQMSEALGHDFSRVRVHTGSEADALSRQFQAMAFTTGPDIFFRRGEYTPGAAGGRELIAHELCHVVQQSTGRVRRGRGGPRMTVRAVGDAFEREADQQGGLVEANIARASSRGWTQQESLATASGFPSVQRACQTIQRRAELEESPSYDTYDIKSPKPPGGGAQTAHFNMRAKFRDKPEQGIKAGDGEVRQFIKWQGTLTMGAHGGFDPQIFRAYTWYEDRDAKDKRYGYRSGEYMDAGPGDQYVDEKGQQAQQTGSRYKGEDTPGKASTADGGIQGKWWFWLKAIDTSRGGKVLGVSKVLTVDWGK
jgi:hypothetical protein